MTTLTIGLVTEGLTDQIVFRALLGGYCQISDASPDLHFEDLHPNPDATSGGSEGGWTRVLEWCQRHSPEDRRRFFLTGERGLFADDLDGRRCDLILVHMDSDICERIGHRFSASPVPTASSPPEARGAYIEATLREWLWPDGQAGDDKHVIAPAVEATETWLVAALSAEAVDESEKTELILLRLAEIFFALKGKAVPPTLKKFKKHEERYRFLSERAAGASGAVAQSCPHFKKLVEALCPAQANA